MIILLSKSFLVSFGVLSVGIEFSKFHHSCVVEFDM